MPARLASGQACRGRDAVGLLLPVTPPSVDTGPDHRGQDQTARSHHTRSLLPKLAIYRFGISPSQGRGQLHSKGSTAGRGRSGPHPNDEKLGPTKSKWRLAKSKLEGDQIQVKSNWRLQVTARASARAAHIGSSAPLRRLSRAAVPREPDRGDRSLAAATTPERARGCGSSLQEFAAGQQRSIRRSRPDRDNAALLGYRSTSVG